MRVIFLAKKMLQQTKCQAIWTEFWNGNLMKLFLQIYWSVCLSFKLSTFAICFKSPDPGASAVDAFPIQWNTTVHYNASPPFSVISKVLQKMNVEQMDLFLVTPFWPTQLKFSKIHPLHKMRFMPPIIQHALLNKRLSEANVTIILSSWQESTRKWYRTYLQKWMQFSVENVNLLAASVIVVLEFLRSLYVRGLGYNGLNTACSS